MYLFIPMPCGNFDECRFQPCFFKHMRYLTKPYRSQNDFTDVKKNV